MFVTQFELVHRVLPEQVVSQYNVDADQLNRIKNIGRRHCVEIPDRDESAERARRFTSLDRLSATDSRVAVCVWGKVLICLSYNGFRVWGG
jgi:hypothetical protein